MIRGCRSGKIFHTMKNFDLHSLGLGDSNAPVGFSLGDLGLDRDSLKNTQLEESRVEPPAERGHGRDVAAFIKHVQDIVDPVRTTPRPFGHTQQDAPMPNPRPAMFTAKNHRRTVIDDVDDIVTATHNTPYLLREIRRLLNVRAELTDRRQRGHYTVAIRKLALALHARGLTDDDILTFVNFRVWLATGQR